MKLIGVSEGGDWKKPSQVLLIGPLLEALLEAVLPPQKPCRLLHRKRLLVMSSLPTPPVDSLHFPVHCHAPFMRLTCPQ